MEEGKVGEKEIIVAREGGWEYRWRREGGIAGEEGRYSFFWGGGLRRYNWGGNRRHIDGDWGIIVGE